MRSVSLDLQDDINLYKDADSLYLQVPIGVWYSYAYQDFFLSMLCCEDNFFPYSSGTICGTVSLFSLGS